MSDEKENGRVVLSAEKTWHGGILSDAAIQWLDTGARGTSSNTIFTCLSGVDALQGWSKSHPYDPSDFIRCRKLLKQVPEFRDRLHEMADVSPVWAKLVQHWDEINSLIDEEISTKKCTKAYHRMKELIKEADEGK